MVDGLNFVIEPKPEIQKDEFAVIPDQSGGEKKPNASVHT
jgi:hypothetical protein